MGLSGRVERGHLVSGNIGLGPLAEGQAVIVAVLVRNGVAEYQDVITSADMFDDVEQAEIMGPILARAIAQGFARRREPKREQADDPTSNDAPPVT